MKRPAFFLSSLEMNIKKNLKTDYSKIVKLYDEKCRNEIAITEYLKSSVDANCEYLLLLKEHNVLMTGNKSSKNTNCDHVMITLENMKKYTTFADYFLQFENPREFVMRFIESYKNLLKVLRGLNKNRVCYFDVNYEKICFDKKNMPFLFDFVESQHYDNINILNDYICNYYIWPLEVHIIMYLNESQDASITRTNIEDICKNFVVKNRSLQLLSKEEIKRYYQECVKSLLSYINRPKREIIESLKKYVSTWDNYSLSVLYMQILNNMYKKMDPAKRKADKFYRFFSLHFFLTMSPDPEKRLSIEETEKQLEGLYFSGINWNFVNEWKREEIKEVNNNLINDIKHINSLF